MRNSKLEICANSFNSALAAQIGGAHRVELCDNMAEGGTTPSYGQIKLCKEKLHIEIWPIIRPRGGDFLYNDDEFEIMKNDIINCKNLGCDGLVFGILTTSGEIDYQRCNYLKQLADPLPIAFHRAFDMTSDLNKSLEVLIELGFVRVLTSGGYDNAFNGLEVLKELVIQSNNRIEVMPGAGVNANNINAIKMYTGANNFHSSARIKIKSKMKFKNQTTKMGDLTDEYEIEQSSIELIKKMANQLNTQ